MKYTLQAETKWIDRKRPVLQWVPPLPQAPLALPVCGWEDGWQGWGERRAAATET